MSVASPSYDAIDPGFPEDLRASNESVWAAARILQEKGHMVAIPPQVCRDKSENMAEFGDSGDLMLIQRVEVKHRQLEFTCAEDFPYSTIIVDVAHAWDRADPKPVFYMIFNASKTHLAIVRKESSAHWERVTKHDSKRHRERTFYECPVRFARFLPVEPRLAIAREDVA